MKVLLVQSFVGKEELTVYPIGLVRLASCLRDHEVKVCDLNLYDNPYSKIKEELSAFDPDIAGVSLRNIDNQVRLKPVYYYKEFAFIVDVIKSVKPDIPLVVGGAGFSMFAREIMERNQPVDFGVYLEAEETFPELLRNMGNPAAVKGLYYRKDGEVIFTGKRNPPDLANLPPIDRSYVDMSLYPSAVTSIGVESKRGCCLNCIYCNYPILNGKRIRLRSPEKVVAEIEEMVGRYGVDKFTFVDPVFNVPLEHATQICREIIRRNLRVTWGADMDIRYAERDFLLLAREAGCTDFIFSPDGISNSTLDALGKGITERDIRRIVRLFKTDENLKDALVLFNLMCNPPGETFIGYLKILFFHMVTNYSFRKRGGGSIVRWIRILPETGIHKLAVSNGVFRPEGSLLPENIDGLKYTFYGHPGLKYLDMVVISLIKLMHRLKSVFK